MADGAIGQQEALLLAAGERGLLQWEERARVVGFTEDGLH